MNRPFAKMICDEREYRQRQQTRPSAGAPRKAGYIIMTSSYVSQSAGINCLYRLCDELNRLGYSSFMTGGKVTALHLNAPLIDRKMAEMLCAHSYSAIYPETITGNPLQASTV